MTEPVLDIADLRVDFATADGEVAAVRGVDLSLHPGECLAIVGESGSGKSQLFLAVMGLLARNGRANGAALLDGIDLLGLERRALNRLRGNRITMVFQDPMTALTPHKRVGDQLVEVLRVHRGMGGAAARQRAAEMLTQMRISEPEKRLRMYPHELSGGMRQRVMIAMALICDPAVVIADEPTTALDVTVQAEILDLLAALKRDHDAAIVLISHDLGVVAGIADRVAVMYAGRIVETGPVVDLFASPQHPYTRGLLDSTPRLDGGAESLTPIAGQPPNPAALPPGCDFAPRCPHVFDRCHAEQPRLEPIGPQRAKACHLHEGPP